LLSRNTRTSVAVLMVCSGCIDWITPCTFIQPSTNNPHFHLTISTNAIEFFGIFDKFAT
jgi:hypothetical protein